MTEHGGTILETRLPAMNMQSGHILEISVESVEAAMAAERGGAQRIEFCSDTQVGGVTPRPELLRAVRERVRLPIFSMVRPRGGDFFYPDAEFAAMRHDVDAAKEAGMDGVVLGLLKANGEIDVVRSAQLVEHAKPLPVTFHRAFDECPDLHRSLEDVIKTGATRLLTSGGKRTAPEALGVLGELIGIAGERLTVMPGSGLHAGNIRETVAKTGAREYHAGLSSVVASPAENVAAFEEEVRKFAAALRGFE
ncbi:MAG: copper homeostasis protein CutC [Candidatus Acidiferrum sp.]